MKTYFLFNFLCFSTASWFILFIHYNLFTPLLSKKLLITYSLYRHILGSGNIAVNERKAYSRGILLSNDK